MSDFFAGPVESSPQRDFAHLGLIAHGEVPRKWAPETLGVPAWPLSKGYVVCCDAVLAASTAQWPVGSCSEYAQPVDERKTSLLSRRKQPTNRSMKDTEQPNAADTIEASMVRLQPVRMQLTCGLGVFFREHGERGTGLRLATGPVKRSICNSSACQTATQDTWMIEKFAAVHARVKRASMRQAPQCFRGHMYLSGRLPCRYLKRLLLSSSRVPMLAAALPDAPDSPKYVLFPYLRLQSRYLHPTVL